MLLLGKALGVLSIIYTEFFLLLECNAALNTEDISMKYIEDDHDRFYLKQSRELLEVGNNKIIHLNSASDEDEETSRITVHPPPRIQPSTQIQPSTRSYATSSRPFTSPRTSSRSLILLPEPGINHSVYLAIENPNLNLYTINLPTSEQRNQQPSNPSTQDLPPDYDSVIANKKKNNSVTHAINIPSENLNSEKSSPPKYEDLN